MNSVSSLPQAVFKISDESFQPELASRYKLSVRITPYGLSFAVLDSERNKFIALESFETGKSLSGEFHESRLAEIAEGINAFSLRYQSVNVFVAAKHATLVPSAIFEESKKQEYLRFNHPVLAGESVYSDFIRSLDSYNVYAVPAPLIDFIRKRFPQATIRHSVTALLTGFLGAFKNSNDKKLLLHIHAGALEIVLLEGDRLLFFNSFTFSTPEDLMYYTLFSCEQLRINPEKTELIIYGENEKHSAISELISKYFRHVEFGKRNELFQYSYGFNEYPSHFFYNLLSQALCES